MQLLFPHDSDTYALRVSTRVTTEEFERYKPIDEQMDFHEKLRLLYVALTRARDHLVVSVHRTDREARSRRPHEVDPRRAAVGGGDDAPHWTELDAGRRRRDGRGSRAARPAGFRTRRGTTGSRSATGALANGAAPRVWSATAIATAAAERAASPTPAWPRTRATSSFRRGTRAATAPRSGARCTRCSRPSTSSPAHDVDETAAAQAAAEGVIGREHDIAALARSALASRTVREAVATDDYRREMYVATQVEGHTLEGYVDLVYRTPEGLVVVDYKTDAWRDESDLDAKVARYRLQGASYALALEAATGEPVARCVFLFLGTDGADEREVSDLPQAIEEVRALLAASAGSE